MRVVTLATADGHVTQRWATRLDRGHLRGLDLAEAPRLFALTVAAAG